VLDRTTLLRATAANHRAFFRRYSRLGGGGVKRVDGLELIYAGRQGTLAFPGARAHSSARLDALMAAARATRIRGMSCWSLEADRVLGTLLIARGFEWGWEPWWMALDLAELPEGELGHEVVAFDPVIDRPQREVPYSDGAGDPRAVRHLAVSQGGQTVGHVIVNPWRGVAGIYSMGVAERHRRRGIGRALTLAACRAGAELGCTHAVLNATPEGALLYRTVGFRSLGEGQTWWLHPGRVPSARQTRIVETIGLADVAELVALSLTQDELEEQVPGAGPPLAVTAFTRRPDVADWILERRPDLVSRPIDDRGATLLHFAVEGGDEALARVALAHGADRSVRDHVYGGTPLGWAKHQGRPRLVELLS
jgi:ribosomal protein S18 acetylase RimI-like enzyme